MIPNRAMYHICSFIFTWFLATSSSTAFILFEIIEVLALWVLTDSFRFSCVSVIVFSASLISLLSESIFGEFACSVMLNVFPSILWSYNFKLLFSDFNDYICACNVFCSFLKDSFIFYFNVLSSSLGSLSISFFITITWVLYKKKTTFWICFETSWLNIIFHW